MLPAASPTKYSKFRCSADEAEAFREDSHNKPACCRSQHRQTAVNLAALKPRPKLREKIYITKTGRFVVRSFIIASKIRREAKMGSGDEIPRRSSRRQPRTSPVTSSRTCESARARPACRLHRPARSDAARADPSPPRGRRSPWVRIRRSCPIESSHAPSRAP